MKMVENHEDDLLCEMIKGSGECVVHINGLDLLLQWRWSRIDFGEHGEMAKSKNRGGENEESMGGKRK